MISRNKLITAATLPLALGLAVVIVAKHEGQTLTSNSPRMNDSVTRPNAPDLTQSNPQTNASLVAPANSDFARRSLTKGFEKTAELGVTQVAFKTSITPQKSAPSLSKQAVQSSQRKIRDRQAVHLLQRVHRQFTLPEYYRQRSADHLANSSVELQTFEKRYRHFISSQLKNRDLLELAQELRLTSKTATAFGHQMSDRNTGRTGNAVPSRSKGPAAQQKNSKTPSFQNHYRQRLVHEIAQALTNLASTYK